MCRDECLGSQEQLENFCETKCPVGSLCYNGCLSHRGRREVASRFDFEAQRGPNIKLEKPGRIVSGGERDYFSCIEEEECHLRKNPDGCYGWCERENGRNYIEATREQFDTAGSRAFERGLDSSGTALCMVVGWVAGLASIAMF